MMAKSAAAARAKPESPAKQTAKAAAGVTRSAPGKARAKSAALP